MERFTQNTQDGKYSLEERYFADAVERLGKFEDMVLELEEAQEKLSAKLAVLRDQGKTKSYQFRELMGKKLVNTSMLSLLETYGLK